MKQKQVESQMTRVLSDAIAELRDPRVPLIVTVERVTVTTDYSIARAYVSTIGDIGALLEALGNARGHLQRELARSMNLRRTPTLEFFDANERRL